MIKLSISLFFPDEQNNNMSFDRRRPLSRIEYDQMELNRSNLSILEQLEFNRERLRSSSFLLNDNSSEDNRNRLDSTGSLESILENSEHHTLEISEHLSRSVDSRFENISLVDSEIQIFRKINADIINSLQNNSNSNPYNYYEYYSDGAVQTAIQNLIILRQSAANINRNGEYIVPLTRFQRHFDSLRDFSEPYAVRLYVFGQQGIGRVTRFTGFTNNHFINKGILTELNGHSKNILTNVDEFEKAYHAYRIPSNSSITIAQQFQVMQQAERVLQKAPSTAKILAGVVTSFMVYTTLSPTAREKKEAFIGGAESAIKDGCSYSAEVVKEQVNEVSKIPKPKHHFEKMTDVNANVVDELVGDRKGLSLKDWANQGLKTPSEKDKS